MTISNPMWWGWQAEFEDRENAPTCDSPSRRFVGFGPPPGEITAISDPEPGSRVAFVRFVDPRRQSEVANYYRSLGYAVIEASGEEDHVLRDQIPDFVDVVLTDCPITELKMKDEPPESSVPKFAVVSTPSSPYVVGIASSMIDDKFGWPVVLDTSVASPWDLDRNL